MTLFFASSALSPWNANFAAGRFFPARALALGQLWLNAVFRYDAMQEKKYALAYRCFL